MTVDEDWPYVNDGKVFRALKKLEERGFNFAFWGIGFFLGFAGPLVTAIIMKYF